LKAERRLTLKFASCLISFKISPFLKTYAIVLAQQAGVFGEVTQMSNSLINRTAYALRAPAAGYPARWSSL
jgi:hypothetical protein